MPSYGIVTFPLSRSLTQCFLSISLSLTREAFPSIAMNMPGLLSSIGDANLRAGIDVGNLARVPVVEEP
ncbi:hypothetical protein SAMN03159448_06289 [Sinorhizobium sp. NFACC03]|nr:hypothetical protein SAMN03159448_06289 [Sinorhizobium sp. NFACC03]